jgi:hypothetical protein
MPLHASCRWMCLEEILRSYEATSVYHCTCCSASTQLCIPPSCRCSLHQHTVRQHVMCTHQWLQQQPMYYSPANEHTSPSPRHHLPVHVLTLAHHHNCTVTKHPAMYMSAVGCVVQAAALLSLMRHMAATSTWITRWKGTTRITPRGMTIQRTVSNTPGAHLQQTRLFVGYGCRTHGMLLARGVRMSLARAIRILKCF